MLTNHGTADAAEIAAAALMGNKRAQLVGERTYGDAAVRRAITMDDGGAIILSVAKYYSPDGKAIQDTGVTPRTLVNEPEPQSGVRRKRRAHPRTAVAGRPGAAEEAGRRSGGEESPGSPRREGLRWACFSLPRPLYSVFKYAIRLFFSPSVSMSL